MQLGQGEKTGQNIAVAWFGPTHGCWDWLLQHFEQVTLLTDAGVREWLDPRSDASTTAASSTAVSKQGPEKDPVAQNANSKNGNSKNTGSKNLRGRKDACNETNDTVLLAALEHRSDPRLQVLQSSLTSFPNNSRCIATVLGSDWQGHRRTFPLPDSIESFYWFQLFDRIVPWLLRSKDLLQQGLFQLRGTKQSVSESTQPIFSGRQSKPTSGSGGTNPRVQRLLDINDWYPDTLEQLATKNQLAWIISDHREHRTAWQDTLSSYGVRTVASRPGDMQFWVTPDLIVVDCSARADHPTGQISGSARDAIVHARGMYPDAFLVLADPFPTWGRWESLLHFGVDALIPRPADFAGIMVSWQLWARRNANHAILP